MAKQASEQDFMTQGKTKRRRQRTHSDVSSARLSNTPTAFDGTNNDWQRAFSDVLGSCNSHNEPFASAKLDFSEPFNPFDLSFSEDDSAFFDSATQTQCGSTFGDDFFSIDDATGLARLNSDYPISDSSKPSSSSSTSVNSPQNHSQQQHHAQCSSQTTSRQSCYTTISDMLALLSFESGHRTSTFQFNDPARLSTASSSIPPRLELDEVLRCTKEAVTSVSRVLDCPCVESSHMAFLCASILMRVLFWYRVALGIDGATPVVAASPQMTFPSSTHSRHGSISPRSTTASRAFSVGGYVPDAEDQETMRKLFFLGELRKLSRLVKQLATPTTQSHQALSTCLQQEMNQAIQDFGSALR